MVAGLHEPDQHKHVSVAEAGAEVAGYVTWRVDPARRNGTVTILAVAAAHRLGTTLCEHAFAAMRHVGVEVVEIGTGGDPFHAPARALHEALGCTPVPVTVYYRTL